jgi:dynein heavy chain
MLIVLQLEEAVGQQLDDHIVMLQSMGVSPYKKPFEDRLAKWDTMLNLVRSGRRNNQA